MSKLTAEIDYRDDIGPEKPWGTQSVIVTMELRRGDGIVIFKQVVNEVSALTSSPCELLGKFVRNIQAT